MNLNPWDSNNNMEHISSGWAGLNILPVNPTTFLYMSGKYLDYITYKNFTGLNPVHRENMEIISDVDLRILATWSGCNI